jgi:hypothetical protein
MKRPVLLFLVALFALTPLGLVSAETRYADEPDGFTPNNLIDNGNFTRSESMSGDDINSFLQSKGSWLANYYIPEYSTVPYYCRNESGNNEVRTVSVRQVDPSNAPLYGMRAADLIAARAVRNGINPQVILVLIQRESSGITRSVPSSDRTREWPLFYGFDETMATYGYSCAQAQQKASDFGGLGQQLAYTPYGLSRLYTNANPCSVNRVIDGVAMTMANRATAALYCYTPHVYEGNHNFWYYFIKWFGALPPAPYAPPLVRSEGRVYIADEGELWHVRDAQVFSDFGFSWSAVIDLEGSPYASYPVTGTLTSLVRTSWGRAFKIENGKKRPIMSARIFDAFRLNWSDLVPLNNVILDKIPTHVPLFELSRIQGTGAVYIQSRGQNHHVTDPVIFEEAWGFRWGEVADVPNYSIFQFPITQKLSRLAASNDGTAFYADRGVKYRIPDPAMFARYGFSWSDVIQIETSFLDQIPTAGTLTALISAPDGRVFYVEGAKKRYVSGAVFKARKFSFSDVRPLGWAALNAIPNGSNL